MVPRWCSAGALNPEGTTLPYFLMILAGVPRACWWGCFSDCAGAERPGAILWLGGALEAMGIALRSGSMVGRYFLGLALFVVPQVIVGSLSSWLSHETQKNYRPR